MQDHYGEPSTLEASIPSGLVLCFMERLTRFSVNPSPYDRVPAPCLPYHGGYLSLNHGSKEMLSSLSGSFQVFCHRYEKYSLWVQLPHLDSRQMMVMLKWQMWRLSQDTAAHWDCLPPHCSNLSCSLTPLFYFSSFLLLILGKAQHLNRWLVIFCVCKTMLLPINFCRKWLLKSPGSQGHCL